MAQTAATQPTTIRGARPEKIAEGTTEVIAEMRDKAKLAGNLYLPHGNGPFPCVVTRTPYGKDAMFANPAAAKRYTDAGLAYLVQDVRGKGRSEGLYQAFINDAFDGYDTIEWMAQQPWCNGKIGITGASAMGAVFALASGTANITTAPPEAVAIGMRTTFALAAALIVAALLVAIGSRAFAGRFSPTGAPHHSENR